MLHWTHRDISREAAAAALNLNINTLDVWLHRYRTPSGKRKGARIFSVQDLVTLQTSRQLLSPDILASRAVGIAVRHLEQPPDYDAALFVTKDRDWLGHRRDEWPEENCTIVNAGWVRRSVEQAIKEST